MTATYGQVVLSKAGRDQGKNFIIVGFIGDDYILISDGELRPIEKPKKKKIKHVLITTIVIKEIRDKIQANEKIQNAEIRKKLRLLQENSYS